MPEILTESFCERCGTRYTFESAAPAGKRLGKFKVLSKGLKNFVLDDESSLDEALAAARGEKDRESTSEQLDAFHKTFNFCMTCRQYTCANCWNEAEGRCLTCAPQVNGGFAAALPALDFNAVASSVPEAWPKVDQLAWPTTDLPVREVEPAPVFMLETQVVEQAPEPAAATSEPAVLEQNAAESEAALDATVDEPDPWGRQIARPPLPASGPTLERELAAYFSDAEPALRPADEPGAASTGRDAAAAAASKAAYEAVAAAPARDLNAGPDAGSATTPDAGAPELDDLRAAIAQEPVDVMADAESYEVAGATDPHILARLASIAAPAETPRAGRGKAKVVAADDAAGLIGDAGAPFAAAPDPRTQQVMEPLSAPTANTAAPIADAALAAAPETGRHAGDPAAALGSDAAPERIAGAPAADRAQLPTVAPSPLLRKLRPGQSLDAALDAFEAALGDRPTPVGAPEPARDRRAEPELAAAAEPDIAPPGEADLAARADPDLGPPGRLDVAAAANDAAAALDAPATPQPDGAAAMAVPWLSKEREHAAAAHSEVAAAVDGASPGFDVPAPEQPDVAAAAEPALEPSFGEPAAPAGADPAWPASDTGSRAADALPSQPATPRSRPADDRVEVPTWRVVAPDTAPAGSPESVPHQPPSEPVKPEWPGRPGTDSLAFLDNRGARPAPEGIWAASTRDLLAPPNGPVAPASIQSCVSCGLSLSATARFCRRCGTRQGA